MKPKEAFGLIVRVFGLIGLAYCIRHLVKNPADCVVLLVARVVFALIALYMIRGASLLVKFAYPECPACSTEKPSA